ncbi:hypothetical protein CMI37_15645 [Candidatus Pacearchaeota archaeon]|nr:hypothetical protein [Candidatus Pacearchaeota archaeon]
MIDPVENVVPPAEKSDVFKAAHDAFVASGLPDSEFMEFTMPYTDWLARGMIAWTKANRN